MAVDHYLKKIETLLTPGPNDPPTGFITAEDLREAFTLALMAIDETYAFSEEQVVGTLLNSAEKKGHRATYQVLDDLRHVLAAWDNSFMVNDNADQDIALFPEVHGEAVPTTIAQTAQLLNNLIAALDKVGLIRDTRQGVVVTTPPPANPATGINPPTAPAKAWTFQPNGATLPVDLAALKGAANVGDAALAGAGQTAFGADQFIVLGDGSRATWSGTAWSAWTPAITGLAKPQPGTFEWTFAPAGAAPLADFAALDGDPVVGTAALNALTGAAKVDFTTGQFITLGDGSKASFTADAAGGPGGAYSWKAGAAQ